MQEAEIKFEANDLHFLIIPYGAEWGWTAYDDATHWNEVDDNGSFDTAAEAQQDALKYASAYETDKGEWETVADLRRELSPRVL